jgi:5S rRNA maturation endonuclease (ribonuclease M5)
MKRPDGFIDVDRLQAETTLEEAAAKCGVILDAKGSGSELRIDCPFGCLGDHAGRREIATNITNPQKIFQCHAYSCGFRGNMLTLMHGWTTGTRPSGGKLKGEEFQRIKRILAGNTSPQEGGGRASPQPTVESGDSNPPPTRNVPLIDSADPKVRELHDIDKKFVTDIANMNPAASAYLRRHPCLTPESMKKWRCGYLPNDGGGDKRGWSLKGCMVYPVLSETGKVLCWVGRDLQYEQKAAAFSALTPAERSASDPPAKHRFPKGFHRGNELFGQQACRLNEPGYREFIAKHGLIIVEGFNDVINLDNHGIPALGIMSNRITEAQVEKVTRWALQLANNRVNLMFDNDDAGVEGAKDVLWRLAERRIDVRLAWSPNMFDGNFKGKQPESILTGFPGFQ